MIVVLIIEKKTIEYTDDIENTYKIDSYNNEGELHEENKILQKVIEEELEWREKEKWGQAKDMTEFNEEVQKLSKAR